MELSFKVDVPFEIPTLRFVLERKPLLTLSCYFDKGREMFALALHLKSLDDIGRCAQLLAKSAAWTVEVLERWPRNEETGLLQGDMAALTAFLGGKPLLCACAHGAAACLDSEANWSTS